MYHQFIGLKKKVKRKIEYRVLGSQILITSKIVQIYIVRLLCYETKYLIKWVVIAIEMTILSD